MAENNYDEQPPPVRAELASAQPHQTQASTRSPPPLGRRQHGHKSTRCRFYGTKRGCRAGDTCPYVHDVASTQSPLSAVEQSGVASQVNVLQAAVFGGEVENAGAVPRLISQPVRQGPSFGTQVSGVTQKPIPRAQAETPREFEINQIRRRFHAEERPEEDGAHLIFKMTPSDPDFNFGVESLECQLWVPLRYPAEKRPSIGIMNRDLDAQYKVRVQQKFTELANGSGTLLSRMNMLDKSLVNIFRSQTSSHTISSTDVTAALEKGSMAQEKEAARKRRQAEVTQLTSRLGRSSLFSASSDGITFKLPIQPLKPHLLPDALKSVKVVKLIVPQLYPLEPCQIRFLGISEKVTRNAESAFENHVIESPNLTLVAHLNYLSASLHTLAMRDFEAASNISTSVQSLSVDEEKASALYPPETAQALSSLAPQAPQPELSDKPHVHVIPRPPEWAHDDRSDDDESDISDDSGSEDSFTDEDEEDAGGVRVPDMLPAPTGTRVSLDFPSLDLYGIELLELKSLSLTLKCERCKELVDLMNTKIGDEGVTVPARRVESCRKCGNYLSIGFRRELIHPNSHRAGYLSLEGCLAVDLLPSNFLPTCSNCSTTFPAPGVVAVRGDSASVICRGCHHRMRFKLPEVKFLLASAGTGTRASTRPAKKPKESLGIVAGQELPRRGRCVHYGKSYRWFRFSCCAKVFPCDKCHDAATDHPNEHANRMICGFCSREQIYRPEDCGICRSTLIGKAGSGFWEGGKGTRDKVRMNRKDPRKYKRRGGTAPASSSHQKK